MSTERSITAGARLAGATGRGDRASMRAALASTLVGLLTLSACGGAEDTGEPSASAPAETASPQGSGTFPQFSASTLDGGQFDFGSLEGRDTVLWFWARSRSSTMTAPSPSTAAASARTR